MSDVDQKLRDWLTSLGLLCTKPPIIIGEVCFERPIKLFSFSEISNISVGAYSYFAAHTIASRSNIGRYCSIGGYCKISPGKHPVGRLTSSPATYRDLFDVGITQGYQPFIETEKVIIGHDVWIGDRSLVLDGVTIGTGAIVGAGSVVTRDVAPYSIVVGAPAKVKRMRFPDALVERLLKSNWWHYDLNETVRLGVVTNWEDPARALDEIEVAVSAGRFSQATFTSAKLTRMEDSLRHEAELPPLY